MLATETPGEPPRRSWRAVLGRTARQFRDDQLTHWAAALTYYAMLSFFPGLLVLVALLGLFGQHPETTDALLAIVGKVGPESAVETFEGPVRTVVKQGGGAGALIGVGLLVSLWSASGYVGAFMSAANAIYGVREGRSFWRLRPLQVALTLTMVILLALLAIALVLTGPLARAVGEEIGLADAAVSVWNYGKWPLLLAVVMGMFATLYFIAPNVRQPRLRLVSPGSVVAVLAWVLASAAFAFYVANFGSYNKTYGALGGAVIFLVWLWISNLALLFGLELDSELERERELRAGLPAEEAIQLPPKQQA